MISTIAMVLPLFVSPLLEIQDPQRMREVGLMAARRAVSAPLPTEQGEEEEYVFGRYHALLIAVQSYHPHEADLRTAANDARAFAEVLETQYGFHPPKVLIDQQATRAGILEALDELADQLELEDNLVIFFAGHGTKMWSGGNDAEGYWIPWQPADGVHKWWNWISSETIHRAIGRIPARHILLISDSCYAGRLTRGEVRMQSALTPDWIRTLHGRSSNQILTSGADEPVADDGRDGHSIFAWHLLDALRQSSERFLPAAALAHHLTQAVMQDVDYHRGRRPQRPLFAQSPVNPRNAGDLLFVRTGAPATGDLRIENVPGAPPGYRFPNIVEVEQAGPGEYRFWVREADQRLEMMLIPGGTVQQGDQTVSLEPFLIDRFEVSNERFDRFILQTRSEVGSRPGAAELKAKDLPATGMSLQEARGFAAWASKRLPTSLEWERAAFFDPERGRTRHLPWGDKPLVPPLPVTPFPPAIGSHPEDRSALGVLGMGGSVRELCELDQDAYRTRAPFGIVRGGTQVRSPRTYDPSILCQGTRWDHAAREQGAVGFRCVLDLIPPTFRKR